jgi:hypothetical protein
MSRLDELPADQRAALSLLLRQRKSYSQVASLLGIPERAVHDRAHAALAVLAPAQARQLSAAQREEIGDYVLGQQAGISERLQTRSLLGNSEPGRAWARKLTEELTSLADVALPDIPPPSATEAALDGRGTRAVGQPAAEASPLAPAPAAERTRRPSASLPSSRVGGALLLAGLLAAVVVAVVLITSGGGSHPRTVASTTRSTSANGPRITKRLTLTPPNPSSKALGLVEILAEGGKRAYFIAAEHLPPSRGFNYVIWLYNSASSAEALSRTPTIGSSERLSGGALLPANAGSYHEVLLTQETSQRPTQPGPIVLRGPFSLG